MKTNTQIKIIYIILILLIFSGLIINYKIDNLYKRIAILEQKMEKKSKVDSLYKIHLSRCSFVERK